MVERENVILGIDQCLEDLHVVDMICVEESKKVIISFSIHFVICITCILALIQDR